MYNVNELINLINKWGIDRGLTKKNGTSGYKQSFKLLEEVEEFQIAFMNSDRNEMIDAIGDCLVVLIQMARIENISIEEALHAAYNEIKDRKGQLVDGVFVKEV